jgi:hypothetical protein
MGQGQPSLGKLRQDGLRLVLVSHNGAQALAQS